jgi:hypothetical protein
MVADDAVGDPGGAGRFGLDLAAGGLETVQGSDELLVCFSYNPATGQDVPLANEPAEGLGEQCHLVGGELGSIQRFIGIPDDASGTSSPPSTSARTGSRIRPRPEARRQRRIQDDKLPA